MAEQTEALEIKAEPCSEEELKAQNRRGLIHQITMSLLANLSVLGPSMGFGYSAVILPTLRSGHSDVTVDADGASWIAGAAAFGTPIGCILSSLIMRRGRRLSLLVTSTFSLIGWVLIYMSTDYEKLIVGRIVGGVATGLASVTATVYSAEIANAAWRGTMVTWSSLAIAFGILLVYIFGYFLQHNWRLIALLCGLFPAVSLIATIVAIPESPLWLRDRGRMDEARVVMKKFRGVPKDHPVTAEVEAELRQSRNNQRSTKDSLLKNLSKRSALYPFAVMLAFFFFQQFSGLFVIVYYAVDIAKAAGMQIDEFLAAILIGLTRLLGCFLVGYASKRWGRRKSSIVSGVGMTLFMTILTIYLYLKAKGHQINDYGIVPTVCISMFIFMSTIGFLTLPFAMVGEIYPAKVKEALSGLTTCIGYVFSFITVKTYPSMVDAMGKHGVFFFYAIVSLLGTVFVLMFLPETKGKTLHDIDTLFSKKKNAIVEVQLAEVEKMVPMKKNGSVV